MQRDIILTLTSNEAKILLAVLNGAIMQTPTSNTRNTMTDINIKLMHAIGGVDEQVD